MVSPQDQQRLFMAGSFGDNSLGGMTPEQFGAWSRAMQRAITPPMETRSSILTWTKFEDPDVKLLANEYLYFAHRVENAACNRWVADLARYNLVQERLREGIDQWDEEGERWDPPDLRSIQNQDQRIALAMLFSIGSDEERDTAEQFLSKCRRDSRIIQLKIERAMRSGYMRDYAYTHTILAQSDPDRINNAEVYEAMGFFGKRFIDICNGNMQTPGQRQTQFVHAHQAEDSQGRVVGGDRNRRRRKLFGGSSDSGDSDDGIS